MRLVVRLFLGLNRSQPVIHFDSRQRSLAVCREGKESY